jgi:hypothetical protein
MQERIRDMPDGLKVFVHDEEFIFWKDVCKITSLGYRSLLELYKNGFFVKLFWSGLPAEALCIFYKNCLREKLR